MKKALNGLAWDRILKKVAQPNGVLEGSVGSIRAISKRKIPQGHARKRERERELENGSPVGLS